MPPRRTAGPVVLSRSVRAFLRQPRTARLATIGPGGYPHVVPVWFAVDGDDLVFGSDDGEQKVLNARRDPRAAVVVGGEPDSDEAGYLIQGDISVDREVRPAVVRKLYRKYGATPEDWGEGERVVLRLKPRRVIRVW